MALGCSPFRLMRIGPDAVVVLGIAIGSGAVSLLTPLGLVWSDISGSAATLLKSKILMRFEAVDQILSWAREAYWSRSCVYETLGCLHSQYNWRWLPLGLTPRFSGID